MGRIGSSKPWPTVVYGFYLIDSWVKVFIKADATIIYSLRMWVDCGIAAL